MCIIVLYNVQYVCHVCSSPRMYLLYHYARLRLQDARTWHVDQAAKNCITQNFLEYEIKSNSQFLWYLIISGP